MSDNGNNLRDANGGLIGGLVVFEYNAGIEDFEAGEPPPEVTSPSYDLGRQRAAEKKAGSAQVTAWLKREGERVDATMEAMLTPEQYIEYRASLDAMKS